MSQLMVPGLGLGRACSNERPFSSVKGLLPSCLQVLDFFQFDGRWIIYFQMWPGEKTGQRVWAQGSSTTEATHSDEECTGSVIRMDALTGECPGLRVVTESGVQEQSKACFPHPTLGLGLEHCLPQALGVTVLKPSQHMMTLPTSSLAKSPITLCEPLRTAGPPLSALYPHSTDPRVHPHPPYTPVVTGLGLVNKSDSEGRQTLFKASMTTSPLVTLDADPKGSG